MREVAAAILAAVEDGILQPGLATPNARCNFWVSLVLFLCLAGSLGVQPADYFPVQANALDGATNFYLTMS